MALYEKRLKARELRRAGESILYIARELMVSKSSVSVWCSDIVLSDTQIEKLSKRRNIIGLKGRMIGAKANKQKKIDSIKKADKEGNGFVKNLSKREVLLIATALYWAEGSKSDSATGFQFVNSDPDMICCMKQALHYFSIDSNDLFCTIQINEMHKPRIREVLNFWKNLLEFKDEQFRNTTFIKTVSKKKYENYNSYYGICRLQVKRSTTLKYKMLGLIKALKSGILHVDVAQLVRASHS